MYKIFTKDQSEALSKAMSNEQQKSLIDTLKTQAAAEPEKYGSFEVVISTEDVDRMGDVVVQEGIDTTRYMDNPVVLWGHDYGSLPIGIATEIVKEKGRTIAKGFFAPEDANPLAQQARKLYDLGILRTVSIGFIPKLFDANDETKILESELLEFSFVSIPANPHALSLVKEAGLDMIELVQKGFMEEIKKGEEVNNPEKKELKNLDLAQELITTTLTTLTTNLTNAIAQAGSDIMAGLVSMYPEDQQPAEGKSVDYFKIKSALEQLTNLKDILETSLSKAKVQDVKSQSSDSDFSNQESENMAKVLKLVATVANESLKKFNS